MPVAHAIDGDSGLIVYRFFKRVSVDDVREALSAVARAAAPGGTFRSLLLFEHTADLSDLTAEELLGIKTHMMTVYDEAGIRHPAGAAVLDDSLDAQIIVPLWRAVCAQDPELEVEYRLFPELGPACAWLEVEPERCAAVVRRTAPPGH